MLDEPRAAVLETKDLKKILVKNVVRVARRAGFFCAYGYLRSRLVNHKVAILAYHRIDRTDNCPWSIKSITPEDFEQEIIYLRRRYQVISLNELIKNLSDFRHLSQNTAVVTIDDGYKDAYFNAYPVLKKYNIPATVFLTTGHIGNGDLFWWDKISYVIWNTKLNILELGELGTYHLISANERRKVASIVIDRLKQFPVKSRDEFIERLVRSSGVNIPSNLGEELILSWDDIREMSQNGISFGAHTVNHPILTRLPLEKAQEEIIGSKQHIEDELDQEVTTFSYPNGRTGDFNNGTEEILKNNGFKCAVLAPSAFVSHKSQLYQLPRISGEVSLEMFDFIMSGLYLDLVAAGCHLGE